MKVPRAASASHAAPSSVERTAAPYRHARVVVWTGNGPTSAIVGLVMFPGDIATPLEQLRLAVPGLAGLVGFLLLPTLGAWLRWVLETMESSQAHLGRPKRVSTLGSLRVGLFSLASAFFVLTLFRAASELRSVETEAAVVGPSIQGALIGIAFWIVYGLGLSTLRADAVRYRSERRVGGWH